MMSGIGYITKYIFEYDAGVPLPVILGVCLVVLVIVAILFQAKVNGISLLRKVSWCLFGGYVFLVFCATVFFRNDTGKIQYSFRPLWCYTTLYYRFWAGTILNILMFLPIGFLAGVSLRHGNVMKILGIGFLLSMMIELLQLFSRRGVCNIDDVIHNTIGCILGYGIMLLCKMMEHIFIHYRT